MANKKISELPLAGAITGIELVELVQGGSNVQSTAADLSGGTSYFNLVGTAYIGGDQTGDARGDQAMDIQAGRSNVTHVASGIKSVAIGYDSTASGYLSTASGVYSTASGDRSIASGAYSTASGYLSTASGYSSTASDNYSLASGYYSTASGGRSTASGYASTASGYLSIASGAYSTASGNRSTASGWNSLASGYYSTASGKGSTASGYKSTASGYASTAEGIESWAAGAQSSCPKDTLHAFTVGDGLTAVTVAGVDLTLPPQSYQFNPSTRTFTDGVTTWSRTISNVVFAAGDTTFDISAPLDAGVVAGTVTNPNVGNKATALGYGSTASGKGSIASGWNSTASGYYSIASGQGSIASGFSSTASGYSSLASGVYSIASGAFSTASGNRSTASGYQSIASGYKSTASGFYSTASGLYSTASGYSSIASGYGSTASGAYSTASGDTPHAFTVGDGLTAVTVAGTNLIVPPANYINTQTIALTDGVTLWNRTISAIAFGAGDTTFTISSPLDAGITGGTLTNDNVGKFATAQGPHSTASGLRSSAFGDYAVSRINYTTNICGPQIIRKDNGEGLAETFNQFCGVEVVLMSPIEDLKTVTDYVITLPNGCHFYPDECGVIITAADTVAVQATVRFGISGTPAKLLAAAITTTAAAVYDRHRFQTLLSAAGEVTLSAGVTIAATATTLTGRFYWRGLLVED